MTWLGVDFGTRRIGLAISDAAGRFALPYATLERHSDAQAVKRIRDIARREGVERLVVGEPRNVDGSRGRAAARARAFARRLAAATELPFELVDECLTSNEARRRLREAGIDARRSPQRVDEVAAQILLEEALGRRKRP
jgi:putative Holliday junction resolvase